MEARRFHLPEFNIARLKAPLHSSIMKGFVDFLAPVSRFAEESPGYVWRLVAPDGQASSYLPPAYEDERIVTNLTVWGDIESLKNFVYQTIHTYLLRSRKKWFEQVSDRQVVLWWIPRGHIPMLQETREKLRCLQETGPGPDAFTFQDLYNNEGKAIQPGLRTS